MPRRAALETFWGWGNPSGGGRVQHDEAGKLILVNPRGTPYLELYTAPPVSHVEAPPILTQKIKEKDAVVYMPTSYRPRELPITHEDTRKHGLSNVTRFNCYDDIVAASWTSDPIRRGGAFMVDDLDNIFGVSRRNILDIYDDDFYEDGDLNADRWSLVDRSTVGTSEITDNWLNLSTSNYKDGFRGIIHNYPVLPLDNAAWEVELDTDQVPLPKNNGYHLGAMAIMPKLWAPYDEHQTAKYATPLPLVIGFLINSSGYHYFFGDIENYTRFAVFISNQHEAHSFKINIGDNIATGYIKTAWSSWKSIGRYELAGTNLFYTGNPFGYYASFIQSSYQCNTSPMILKARNFKLTSGEWNFAPDSYSFYGDSYKTESIDFRDNAVIPAPTSSEGRIMVATSPQENDPERGGYSICKYPDGNNEGFASFSDGASFHGTSILRTPLVIGSSDRGIFVEGVAEYDIDPPVVTKALPVTTVEALPNAEIYIEVDDEPVISCGGVGVDIDTLEVYVQIGAGPEIQIVDGNSIIAGTWEGNVYPDNTGGYDITINPTAGFSSGDAVQVRVEASDLNGNAMASYIWIFNVVAFGDGIKFDFFKHEDR